MRIPAALFSLMLLSAQSSFLLAGEITDEERNAVSTVFEKLASKKYDEKKNARELLSRNISPAKLPFLMQALQSPSPDTRCNAAGCLCDMRTAAASALPLLMEKASSDQVSRVRAASLVAVKNIGGQSAAVYEAILKALKDPNESVRSEALNWSTKWEELPRDARAVPILLNVFLTDAEDNRRHACQALRHFMEQRDAIVPILSAAALNGDDALLEAIIRTLVELKANSTEALNAYRVGLNSPLPDTLNTSLEACIVIGKSAAPLKIDIEALLKYSNTAIQLRALDALDSIEVPVEHTLVIEIVRSALHNASELTTDEFLQSRAIQRAARLGPAIKPLVPAILPLLKTHKYGTGAILEALDAGREGSKEALPAILELLAQQQSEYGEARLLKVLMHIGPSAEHLPLLMPYAKRVRFSALSGMRAIAAIRPSSPQVLDFFLSLLDEPTQDRRHYYASRMALCSFDADDAKALCVRMLNDKDYMVRNCGLRTVIRYPEIWKNDAGIQAKFPNLLDIESDYADSALRAFSDANIRSPEVLKGAQALLKSEDADVQALARLFLDNKPLPPEKDE